MEIIAQEPLLYSAVERRSLLPVQHPDVFAFYKKAQSSVWTLEEITFRHDVDHWERLDNNTRTFIKMMLAFFSGADDIVNENVLENLCKKIKIMEARLFFHFQMHIEDVHIETYGTMIDLLIKDPVEKAQLLDAVNTMPGIKRLYDWAKRWIALTPEKELATNPRLAGLPESDARQYAEIWCFAKQLVAFACVEGIMFSGPFASIFWLKEKGIMPGLTFSNELISRDEGLHLMHACYLYSLLKNRLTEEEIHAIIGQAVEFEKELIGGCLDKLTGMVQKDMFQYIEFVGDRVAKELGYSPIYGASNPFPFMDKISFSGITNFFERRVAEYGLAGKEAEDISLDDDY